MYTLNRLLRNPLGQITRRGIRNLHIHEYQSKALLRRFCLNVQKGACSDDPKEAYQIAKNLQVNGAKEFVIKCQIHAGGRGKGYLSSGLTGGVHVCKTPEEVLNYAKQMIGYNLITKQTGVQGELVNKVLVLESVTIVKELYLALVLDPAVGGPVFVASQKGGVNIEEVAEEYPDAVIKIPINDPTMISREDCMRVASALGLETKSLSYPLNVADQFERLFDMFIKLDATTIEINPLAVTSKCGDHLMCVDAKFTLDDNAAYRQQEIFEMEDKTTLDARDLEAQEAKLNFVPMEGSIGCLVNGAGLAMATMDIVKLFGKEPANFLDVGGGADVAQVTRAFEIIKKDQNVKVIFVNIFGGIMRCDIIAEGLIAAVKATGLRLPLVVRLVGNRVKEGRRILEQSGISLVSIDDLESAAKTACLLASKN